MTNNYDDIINLPHHVSKTHPQMSLYQRSAQFAPFAALTGYEEKVVETARLTNKRIELSEEEKALLDEKINLLEDSILLKQKLKITYFIPDKTKEGGEYLKIIGIVKKIDRYNRIIVLNDFTQIPIEEVFDIEEVK